VYDARVRGRCIPLMSRTHALALTILALSSLNAAAQDAGSSNDRFSGKAALGYISTSGNTDSTSANASLSLGWALTAWSHAFELSGIGASTDDQTTAEAYLFKYEARRAFGEHGYLFTALDYKRDRFSGYAEQVSQTVGYGRRLIDRDRHKLDAGVGFGARQSELRDGTEEDDAIVRGSVDYFWTLSDTTEFEQRLVIESGSTNTMTEARSALRARIVGNVALVLSYRIKLNSSVPEGATNADRFTAISLEYAF
jgi:putative salt-induced outer membrane protein